MVLETKSILSFDSMLYMTVISLEMSDEPKKIGDIVINKHYGTSGTEKLRLVKQTMGDNSVEYAYDKFGNVIKKTTIIQGQQPLEYNYTYNDAGQLVSIVYPGDLVVEYEYDKNGYKSCVKADGNVVYNLETNDGKTMTSSFLGELTSSLTRDDNGFESNVSILMGNTVIDSFDEEFDPITGNMLSRFRKGNYKADAFEYDDLDRLTVVRPKDNSNSLNMRIWYADNGNITKKTGIGSYEYDDDFKPHAVIGVSNDNDLLPISVRSVSYNSFGKVKTIVDEGSHYSLSVDYGPDMERCYSALSKDGKVVRTVLYGGDYEKVVENGVTHEFYYLDGNVIVIKENGEFYPYLALTDNLGSYLSLVNLFGEFVYKASYDAWGKQTISKNSVKFHRGYSGHSC